MVFFPGLLRWDLWPHLRLSLPQCKEGYTGNLLVLVSFLLGFQSLTGILSHLSSQLTTGSRSLREWSPVRQSRKDPHPAETLYSSVSAFFSQSMQIRSFLQMAMVKSVPFSPSYCRSSLPYHRPICLVASHTGFYLKTGDTHFLRCNQQHCTGVFRTVVCTLGLG